MGFFDQRCMISGLSLMPAETVLIFLEKKDNNFLPLSLPLFGNYNRFGAIDSIQEAQHITHLFSFFKQHDEVEEDMFVDWNEAGLECFESINDVMLAVERGVTQEYDTVKIKDRPISFCLISKLLWEEIVKEENKISEINFSDFHAEAYRNQPSDYALLLCEMQQIQCFLNLHQLTWHPPNDGSQHYEEDVRKFAEEARTKFSGNETIRKAINGYLASLD